MVKGTCTLSSALTPLLCALLATTATLPASLSVANATLPQLSNGTLTFASSIPVASWKSYHYRNVILKLTSSGQEIPESEVQNTLVGAELVAGEFLDQRADESIPNNRFEYQRPDGNMLIAIKARVYHQITWLSLFHVLQALQGFMTASRPFRKPHFESLEFEIELTGNPEVAGTGLIWYLPPGSDLVQRNTIATAPSSIANQTLLQLTNATSLSLGTTAGEDITYHIPRTSLTLSFYYAEGPLPPDEVITAIRGAMAYVSPQATGPYKNDAIPGDRFQWVRLDSVGVTTRVAVTVFLSEGHNMSWKQLYDVLYGLYQFATGMNGVQPHYETLGFRILNDPNGKLGVGTLSYFEPEPREVERRAETTNEKLGESAVVQAANSTINPNGLGRIGHGYVTSWTSGIVKDAKRALSPTFSLPRPSAAAVYTSYPVPGTPMTLFINSFGHTAISPAEMSAALTGALSKIYPHLAREGDQAIPDNGWMYGDVVTNVWLSIIVWVGSTLSWQQLSWVINGLLQWMTGPGRSDITSVSFDFYLEGEGYLGMGALVSQYPPAGAADEVEKMIANETAKDVPATLRRDLRPPTRLFRFCPARPSHRH